MKHRIVPSVLTLAFSLCVVNGPRAAAQTFANTPAATTTSSTATSGKMKLVSFHMRNDSATPLIVQYGEQQITIQPGKTSDLKVQQGLQIVAVNAAGHVAAGAVLTTVSKDLSGNTIAIN